MQHTSIRKHLAPVNVTGANAPHYVAIILPLEPWLANAAPDQSCGALSGRVDASAPAVAKGQDAASRASTDARAEKRAGSVARRAATPAGQAVLRTIARLGHASTRDVYEMVHPPMNEQTVRDRICDLRHCRLIFATGKALHHHRAVTYALTEKGRAKLEAEQ
jgi:hypothetical protein